MATDNLKKLLDCLSSSKGSAKVEQFVDKLDRDSIIQVVPGVLGSHCASELLGAILDSLFDSSQNRNALALRLMEVALEELRDGDIEVSPSMEIVHVLSLASSRLSSDDLAKLIQILLSFLSAGRNLKGKWLSLFPMLYSELSKHSRILVDGQSMTGEEYCDEIAVALCNVNISVDDAVAFASVLRELKLAPSQVGRLIEKLCATLPDMEPQGVPPLVYQLLFLCDSSHYLAPLQHLAKYFEDKLNSCPEPNMSHGHLSTRSESMEVDSDIIESGDRQDLLQAKATSIFHVSRAASAGHPLSKELLRSLKAHVNIPELVFVPFTLEVALSLGGLTQHRDFVEVLKNVVQRSLTFREKMSSSAWMRDIFSEKSLDVQLMLVTIMQQCKCEWDHIVKGLELLAFSLLEIRPPRPPGAPSNTSSSNAKPATAGVQPRSVMGQCWLIGSQILLEMVKKFPDSAQAIVQKLVERLQDSGNDSQYIDAVTLLVQHNLLTMLDCKTSLRSLLYNMDYRSVESAKRLYSGISPVLRSSPDLRETAFLILRKLMHSCSEDARQVAVVGLLQILKNFRYYSLVQGLSSSQCSMSSQATVDLHHNNSAAAVNRALCTDLIKLLQSSLGQQSSVRLTLYDCLPEVVSRSPELVPECMKMLRNHLKQYVDAEFVLQLQACVTKDGYSFTVVEPLGHLIQAMLQVILRSGQSSRLNKETISDRSEDDIDQSILLLRKIANKMSSSTIADFDFADSGQASDQVKVQILSSTCVALADFCLANNGTRDKSWAEKLITIHQLHCRLEDVVNTTSSNAKAKTKKKDTSLEDSAHSPKKSGQVADSTCLSLYTISMAAQCIYSPEAAGSSQNPVTGLLKSNSGLHLWLMESSLNKCRTLNTHGQAEGLSTDSIIRHCGVLGRALTVACSSQQRHSCGDKETSIYCMALECLNELLQAACKHHSARVPRLLAVLDGQSAATNAPAGQYVSKMLARFEQLLDSLLSGQQDEDVVNRAVVPVVGILSVLSDQLDADCSKYAELEQRISKLCNDVQCTDSNTVKLLITLLVRLNTRLHSSAGVLLQLARQVRSVIGNLDSSLVVDQAGRAQFATINEDTSCAVLSVISSAVDQLMQITEWAIPRITAATELADMVTSSQESITKVQVSVYSQLTLVANTLSELVQTDFSPGLHSETTMKMCICLYTELSRVGRRQAKTILPQFEKLVKNVAVNLTSKVYQFITHLETHNDHGGRTKKTDKKNKKTVSHGKHVQKVLKGSRSIPALIFALETYSRVILAISKKTKVDLSFGFKPGTSRDFRIMNDIVNEALEDEPQGEASGEDDDEAHPGVRGPAAAKRPAKRRKETATPPDRSTTTVGESDDDDDASNTSVSHNRRPQMLSMTARGGRRGRGRGKKLN